MNIVVRQESPTDYPEVYSLNIAAFKQRKEAKLVDHLRSSKSFIPELSLVACVNDKIVGYILFTKINIVGNGNSAESLALAPISVLPELQRKGVGSILIKEGLNLAKKLGYKSVIVLGHEEYYPRFGFSPTNKWGIKPPFNIPEKFFLGLELEDNAFADMSGTVVYSREFELG